ncbi:MAG TPA: hypothetical protein VMT34_08275 [Aggregatilineales bacterium]|nr:hypothetical protein [Aggregatilineales bacterium]
MKCLICGTEMLELNCKLICPVCGNREDCSDASLVIYDDYDADDDIAKPTVSDESSKPARKPERRDG